MRRSPKDLWIMFAYLLLLAVSVALVVIGRNEAATDGGSQALLATGIVCFIVVAAMMMLTFALWRSRAENAATAELLKQHLGLQQ
jgi:hypothetical protein